MNKLVNNIANRDLRVFHKESTDMCGKGKYQVIVKCQAGFMAASTTEAESAIEVFRRYKLKSVHSIARVINNDFDQKRIENKIILIGSSAQALFDIVKISNGKTVPGVEVHAHIIDNILIDETGIVNEETKNLLFNYLISSSGVSDNNVYGEQHST